jgi:hypothetical protein
MRRIEQKRHLSKKTSQKRGATELRKRSKPKPDFNEILLMSIDEALSSLGKNVATTIYFHLEQTFNIKRLETPQRIKDFSDALEKIFGLGAKTLEILCMKNLHDKIGVTFKWPEYEWPLSKWIIAEMTFQEYVNRMRQNYEKVQKGETEMEVFMHEYEKLQK